MMFPKAAVDPDQILYSEAGSTPFAQICLSKYLE